MRYQIEAAKKQQQLWEMVGREESRHHRGVESAMDGVTGGSRWLDPALQL